jgi:SAM-dependent methyltransferase
MSQQQPVSAVVTTEGVRRYWDERPLCASQIPFEVGTKDWFEYYDKLREGIEPIDFSYELHEYRDFKGREVLDVGCGNGYVLSKYASEGADVTGIDLTPTAVNICRKRFALLGLRGEFKVADAQQLPFERDTFDCVCSMGVLHHVPDTEKAVAEIWRVLKPGGRLIIMMYHRNSIQYQLKYRLVSWVKRRPMQDLVNEFDGVGNPKGDVYSKRHLRRLLHAFDDLEMRVGFLEPLMFTRRLSYFVPRWALGLLQSRVGWNLYAKGRKGLAPRGQA